ncbi:unnamed protein product [Pylaiella littoralis]
MRGRSVLASCSSWTFIGISLRPTLLCTAQQCQPAVFSPAHNACASCPGAASIASIMREVAPLVRRFVEGLDAVEGNVIDLACGSGQNGLFVAQRDQEMRRRNRRVVLLDKNIKEAARCTADLPEATRELVVHEETDLETAENPSPLPKEAFGAALVFNYLHRPLIPNLRDSIKPGGLVLYKTFTWEHPSIGVRPSNPAFLLGPGELKADLFAGWEVLHFFEGVEVVEDKESTGAGDGASGGGCSGRRAAVSSIVCRKPPRATSPPKT